MAIKITQIQGYLDEIGINYETRDDETIVFPISGEENKILIITKVLEDGEFIQMRTVKHLDDLVAQATEEKRVALLKWMLRKNYTRKVGAWEYDPEDHDHHIAVGHPIEDGELTQRQFLRMFNVVANSLDDIPEMKEILGVSSGMSAKEKKRQALLQQLQDLEEDGI